eukprot:8217779-Pyramimonas_sp.AAC.1
MSGNATPTTHRPTVVNPRTTYGDIPWLSAAVWMLRAVVWMIRVVVGMLRAVQNGAEVCNQRAYDIVQPFKNSDDVIGVLE